jgi:predicted acyltransferase
VVDSSRSEITTGPLPLVCETTEKGPSAHRANVPMDKAGLILTKPGLRWSIELPFLKAVF